MTRILEWLLGLENIRLGRDAPLLLRWQSELPSWLLFSLSILVLTLVVLAYLREHGSIRRRMVLAGLRGLGVCLVLIVISRPMLVLQRNRVEPSHVAVLIDTSQSMAAKDQYADAAKSQTIATGAGLTNSDDVAHTSRLELVQKALTRNDAASLQRIEEHNALVLSSFSTVSETQGLASSNEAISQLVDRVNGMEAEGSSTDLGAAIVHAINHAPSRRLAAIVLATDGQSTAAGNLKDAIDLASDRQIPILSLGIGSPDRIVDIEVGPLRADQTVFVNDVVLIEATISARGLSEPTTVTVDLVSEADGQKITSKQVTLGPPENLARVELPAQPIHNGRMSYRVEAIALPREQNHSNNADRVEVKVLDDRVRVLYVDGYPRYEYRYLKNALLREKTVNLSVLLIDADEQFVQEGTDPIRRFPESPEELNRYDAVIFGDVDPRSGWLSVSQMTMLLDYVGHEGGGFAMIAGERSAPYRFLGTPLEKLLPVRVDPEFLGLYEGVQTVGFKPVLTEDGRRSRLFRSFSGHDQEESESVIEAKPSGPENFYGSLPDLYWFARTLGPRPGASVLAQHPTVKTLSGAMPLIVLGRYGAGKIFFQATDDTWRWRRHTGEFMHDAYWVQVARLLCRGDRLSDDRRVVLRTDRRVYSYGSPLTAQVEVNDPDLLSQQRETVAISVTRTDAETADAVSPAKPKSANSLSPMEAGTNRTSALAERIELNRVSVEGGLYEGSFIPSSPGSYTLEVEDIPLGTGPSTATASVRVNRPDLEGRKPEADYATLERMAEQTGGKVLSWDKIEEELASIPDRSVQIPDDVTEPLWDSRIVLVLFVLMISTEWVLRKWYGLV